MVIRASVWRSLRGDTLFSVAAAAACVGVFYALTKPADFSEHEKKSLQLLALKRAQFQERMKWKEEFKKELFEKTRSN